MIEAALIDALLNLRGRRPDLKLVTLADGAPEMQQLLDRVVEDVGWPPAAQTVDFWHLTEKLGAAATAADAADGTLDGFVSQLLESDDAIDDIEQDVRRWAVPFDEAEEAVPQPLHAALTYIENQRARLRYASARAAGLPIGSGHVEATCKTIVTVRFKRAGARWRPDGAQPLLRLRALATSSRWKPAMELLMSSYTAEMREVA